MKTRTQVKVRNLPFVVTKPNGEKRRYKTPEEAWAALRTGGHLTMAFRLA